MIGDSLAGEANNPEKQESQELNSPESSVAESNSSKAPESTASEAILESVAIEEIQETGESSSPEIPGVQSEVIEIQQAPDLTTSEAAETREIQETGESSSPEIPVAQSEVIEIQQAPDLTTSETAETREIQETGESSYPEIPGTQSEVIEIQQAPDLTTSKTAEIREIQETGESSSPEIPGTQSEVIEIQQAPDLTTSETAETREIQETGESSSPEIPGAQSEVIEIQQAPDLATSETAETREIQETGESSIPEIPVAQSEVLEIQVNPELKVAQTATVSDAINSAAASPLPITSETARNKDCLRILITGASGCIGQYIAETLIQETEHELFLLVRDPKKLKIDCDSRPGINIIQGDMKYISRLAKLIKTMDCAILTAAAWGGQQEALDVNVFKTLQLLNYLDPNVCQQVIYFSTASILDRHNHLLKEARELGTEYIRSKYEGLTRITKLPIADRVTTLFPTLVLGGDANHPYSHISSGLPGLKKWINYIRFFKADGSFHFIHAKDIAQVVFYLVKNPPSREQKNWFVLGNQPTTVNQAVEEACEHMQKRIVFRLNLSPWLADIFISLFRIQMAAWDRFCLEYRHFTYTNTINPGIFGLPVYCSTIKDVLKTSGISEPPQIVPNPVNYDSTKSVVNRIKDYRQAFDDKELESENDQ